MGVRERPWRYRVEEPAASPVKLSVLGSPEDLALIRRIVVENASRHWKSASLPLC